MKRMEKNDLIFLGAAMILSQRAGRLAMGTENPGEIQAAIATAQELYDGVSAASQAAYAKSNMPVIEAAKKAGG
jgi:hypothetical protein